MIGVEWIVVGEAEEKSGRLERKKLR